MMANDVSGENQTASVDGLEAKFIDVGNIPTRYYDYGQGETILLVHGGSMGGASTANNWSRNIPGLSKYFRVLAVDRLAQGMTGNPEDDVDFTNQGVTKHIYQFIQTMNLDQLHLVGHSSGGGIMFYLALEHPEIVRTMTIVSVGPQMPGRGPTKFDELLKKCPPDRSSYEHRKCRLLALGHTPETFPPDYEAADEYMGNLPKAVETRTRMNTMRAARPGWPDDENEKYRALAWEKAREGGLQMPILMFCGKQDTLSWGADESHAMMKGELNFFDLLGSNNPRVKMIIINEAGHFPYREHPETFNADLIHFIQYWSGLH
jgi:2-hydroxy-6-oxonona-2,4-dienedioate hydrolase